MYMYVCIYIYTHIIYNFVFILLTINKFQVNLNKLEGKYVVLYIAYILNGNQLSCVDIIDESQNKSKGKKHNQETVFIPIRDHYIQNKIPDDDQDMRSCAWDNLYMVDDQRMITKEVVKLFKDEWNFTGDEPIIVVLDPQGNVVNQNALPMIFTCCKETFDLF